MKIDNVLKSQAAARGYESKSGKSRIQAPLSNPAAVSDNVLLTGTAEKMRELDGALAEIDVTDAAKVEAIRQAIADGSFKVDEEAVAEGLIQESIDLLSHRPDR